MITAALYNPSLVVLTHEVLARAARLLGRRPPSAFQERARQAARVRDMARSVQFTDPAFASDLYAAADRHDQESDFQR